MKYVTLIKVVSTQDTYTLYLFFIQLSYDHKYTMIVFAIVLQGLLDNIKYTVSTKFATFKNVRTNLIPIIGYLNFVLCELKDANNYLIITSPSYPASSFPLTSGREPATLERSDLKSENIGLSIELRMCSICKQLVKKKNNLKFSSSL